MRTLSQNATSLRAEARLVGSVGAMLLLVGFPLTLVLVSLSLSPDGLSPLLPVVLGGPPVLLGYLACRHASARLVQAKVVERRRR